MGQDVQIFSNCYPAVGSSTYFCCANPELPGTPDDCTFVRFVQRPAACYPPAWTPPSYCVPPANDPPNAPVRDATLWTLCPFEGIVLDEANFCVSYNCTGSVTVQVNATTQLVEPIIRTNIAQGVGIDAAATLLDVVGTVFEHLLLPMAMRPLVLS